MDKQEKNIKGYYTIDMLHIVKSLWHRAWVIVLASVLSAATAFFIAAYIIAPTYSSSIMLYVNNSAFSLGGTGVTISSSEITAAQSLVKTYGEILNSRTTLERVIEKADVPYTYKELAAMITSAPSNGTEIMRVTVVSEDPYEAAKIANCISEILPIRISEIIDGASMEVVDTAVPNLDKIAPGVAKYTAVGLVIGAVLSVIALTIAALLDDTIHNEEYVLSTYDYPILAKIPNLLDSGSKQYAYYHQSKTKRKS